MSMFRWRGSQSVDHVAGTAALQHGADRVPHPGVRAAEGSGGDAAQMGGVDHPVPHLRGEVHQRVVGRGGLWGEDVEARAPQPAFDQRLTDRQVVQKIAPGGVDEDVNSSDEFPLLMTFCE